jgi:lysophospholipase L1-like esterase
MKKPKRIIALLLISVTLIGMLASCRSGSSGDVTTELSDTTNAPESTNAEETTKAPEAESALTELNVKWHNGYIGSYSNTNGYQNKVKEGGGSYVYSDVIEIEKKGTMITFSDPKFGKTSSNAYVVSYWKKNGSKWELDLAKPNIRGGEAFIVSEKRDATVYTYISASDNECVRFCLRADNETNRPKIYSGKPTGKSPQTVLNEWIEKDKQRAFYDILKGKTFIVIGDSYFAGSDIDKSLVWPALMAKKYDMQFCNYGIGGSTISTYNGGKNPMVNRYKDMINNNPDIVIIEGGRNDYNISAPLGTLQSTDTATMMGASRVLITKVKEKYPNALIICVTCWEVGGNANPAGNVCSAYGKALIDVCADMGVPCINAMDQKATGVYMTSSTFRATYCIGPNDISHLNADGMKLVLPFFEKAIVDILTSSKS